MILSFYCGSTTSLPPAEQVSSSSPQTFIATLSISSSDESSITDKDKTIYEKFQQIRYSLEACKDQVTVFHTSGNLKLAQTVLTECVYLLKQLASLIQDETDKTIFWELWDWYERTYILVVFPLRMQELESLTDDLKKADVPVASALLIRLKLVLDKAEQMIDWHVPDQFKDVQSQLVVLIPSLRNQLFQLYTRTIVESLHTLRELNPHEDSQYYPRLVQLRKQVDAAMQIPVTYSLESLKDMLAEIQDQIHRLDKEMKHLFYLKEL
jgi:hypothetical protein